MALRAECPTGLAVDEQWQTIKWLRAGRAQDVFQLIVIGPFGVHDDIYFHYAIAIAIVFVPIKWPLIEIIYLYSRLTMGCDTNCLIKMRNIGPARGAKKQNWRRLHERI